MSILVRCIASCDSLIPTLVFHPLSVDHLLVSPCIVSGAFGIRCVWQAHWLSNYSFAELQVGAVPNIMQQWGGALPPAMGYAGMLGRPQSELPPLQGGAGPALQGGMAAREPVTSGWSYPPLPPNFAARE